MNKPTLVFFATLAGYTFAGCNRGESLIVTDDRPGNSVMPMDDSWDRTIGILLYVDAHVTPREVQDNSPHYSFVWNVETWGDDFRRTNRRSNLAYYAFANIDEQNARPDHLQPGQDTLETRQRTLGWWRQEADGVGHPDWILYRCDRVTPAYEGALPNMPLDLTNPAVIDFELRGIASMGANVTAYSADVVTPLNLNHACGVYRNGQWVQLFTGENYDPAYEGAVFNWMREIRRRLAAQRYPRGLVINCPLVPAYDDAEVAQLLANADGILDEEGFTYYGLSRGQVSWLLKIQRMIQAQNRGVAFYSVNYVPRYPPTEDELNWVLGSYLMGREHSAYLVIMEETVAHYGFPPWPHMAEFDQDLGHPCSEMGASQGVYVRDFSKGMALVNPSRSDSFSVALPPGNFTDLRGRPVAGNVSLGPLSGMVLVSSQDRCS